jgi:hypothetical protein
MQYSSKPLNAKSTALVFGLLPCALGLGAAACMRWANMVWLSTAGPVWPIILSTLSAAILIKLLFSRFEDKTSSVAAWLTLAWTWFYLPLWLMAHEVPYSAAVVGGDGRVHIVSEATRYPTHRVWLLTDHSGSRVVHNVVGKLAISQLELDYRHAESYIATRSQDEDLSRPLAAAARAILQKEAERPRGARIALLEQRPVRDRLLERICRATVREAIACPITMSLAAQSEATGLGATWSTYYTEDEAIEEKHLPTLLHLLTQSDSALVRRREVFALLLELAKDVAQLSQVAQQSHLLDDDQFDELIGRILAWPDRGNEAVVLVAKSNRLTEEQRRALRAKALSEASMGALLEHAMLLRVSDAEIAQLAARMRSEFAVDPGVAVRALEVFGERLPSETQRDAVEAVVKARSSSFALAALRHVNFSPELRRDLMRKVLADASHDDFSTARLSKDKLQVMLTPAEMRELVAMAVKRSQTSGPWLDFALGSLPVRAMTQAEQKSLLTELLFKSPKAALEFVSENRRHLEPAEVDEVTRDYTRTIATDLCLHLSHRNKNRKVEYFSETQLQIFRDCAGAK